MFVTLVVLFFGVLLWVLKFVSIRAYALVEDRYGDLWATLAAIAVWVLPFMVISFYAPDPEWLPPQYMNDITFTE